MTYLLALIVLIAWWTVALDRMSTRGFTSTAKIRPDHSWRLEPAVDGCQPDARGASFTGTIANRGRSRDFAVEVRFRDDAGQVVDAATTRITAGANDKEDWTVHGSADPAQVRSCSATATPVSSAPLN
jgi:hypothetical protein